MQKSSLLLFLTSCLLIPFLALCLFAYPSADDFGYTAQAPFWHSQWNLLRFWNGRYTANFLVLCNPFIYGSLLGYRLSAMLLLILVPVSIYTLLRSVWGKAFTVVQTLVFAFIISALIIDLLPSLAEGIYWYTGSVTYMLGAIVACFYTALVVRYYKGEIIIGRFIHLLLCMLLLIISIGFNEVQMLILLVAHLAVWLWVKKGKAGWSLAAAILPAICVVFSLLLILSPGNHVRGSYFTGNYRPFYSLGMTLLQMIRFCFGFATFGPLLLSGILFIPVSRILERRVPVFGILGRIKPLIWFATLLIILFLCIYPAYWGTGILGQHRTVNTACYFFVLMWFLLLHSLYVSYKPFDKYAALLSRKARLYLTIMLAAMLMFSGNSGTAIQEIATGKIKGFDREMKNRFSLIQEGVLGQRKELMVPVLQNRPQSLFVLDLQPDCNHWINQIEARFFGLNNICLDTNAIPH
ncbi:MAG: hypothetical protein HKL88_03640 [Bacteroidia bacterium]|nr:hypothetical protein [Bacteroidia bacterium]